MNIMLSSTQNGFFYPASQLDQQEFSSNSSKCSQDRRLSVEITLLVVLRTQLFVIPFQSHTRSPSVVKFSVTGNGQEIRNYKRKRESGNGSSYLGC